MQWIAALGLFVLCYLIGSIPAGLIVVKLKTGQDLRQIHSGRTGGTNAMRAAGFWFGLFTAILDIIKGASGVWLARAWMPGNPWVEVLAPIFSILGHNYSIYLIERDASGWIRLRGGAGGAPTAGAVMALWPPAFFIVIPLSLFILFGIGYASVATMSVPLVAALLFGYRTLADQSPWQYIVFGIVAEIILMWSLRPNIQRLLNGTERVIGWRARKKKSESDSSNTAVEKGSPS
jgi:glycerol-3-phosphate acyltransferase PlsY